MDGYCEKIVLAGLLLPLSSELYPFKKDESIEKNHFTKVFITALGDLQKAYECFVVKTSYGKRGFGNYEEEEKQLWLVVDQKFNTVKSLLNLCGNSIDINDEKIAILFDNAVHRYHTKLVEFLISCGIDINAMGRFNIFAVKTAVCSRDHVVLKKLFDVGADFTEMAKLSEKKLIDIFGEESPLQKAVSYNDDSMVMVLIERGGMKGDEVGTKNKEKPIDIAPSNNIKQYLTFVEKMYQDGFVGITDFTDLQVGRLWPFFPWISKKFVAWHCYHNGEKMVNYLIKNGLLKKENSSLKWVYFALAKERPFNFKATKKNLKICFGFFDPSEKDDQFKGQLLAFIKTLKFNKEEHDEIAKDKNRWIFKKLLYSNVLKCANGSLFAMQPSAKKLVDCRIKFENC